MHPSVSLLSTMVRLSGSQATDLCRPSHIMLAGAPTPIADQAHQLRFPLLLRSALGTCFALLRFALPHVFCCPHVSRSPAFRSSSCATMLASPSSRSLPQLFTNLAASSGREGTSPVSVRFASPHSLSSLLVSRGEPGSASRPRPSRACRRRVSVRVNASRVDTPVCFVPSASISPP